MQWRDYALAIVLGAAECLAPSDRFRRDLLTAMEDVRVLDDERFWSDFPPRPGLVNLQRSPAEVQALVRDAWTTLPPGNRDGLRASTMVLLGASPGEERRSLARSLCSDLLAALFAQQPLAVWAQHGAHQAPAIGSAAQNGAVWFPEAVDAARGLAATLETLEPAPSPAAAVGGHGSRQTFHAPLSSFQAVVPPTPPIVVTAGRVVRVRLEFLSETGARSVVEIDTSHACRIGRDPTCDIAVADPKMSRQHFRLEFNQGAPVTLHPENARNGILLDGLLVSGPCHVRDGATIIAGSHQIALTFLRS